MLGNQQIYKAFLPRLVAVSLLVLLNALPHVHAAPVGTSNLLDYGAEVNPTGSPIGGGEGYATIFTTGDYTVSTAEELTTALFNAKNGEVVYITPEANINLTGKSNLPVRTGVTLAGNRGYKGSRGPLLYTDDLGTNPLLVLGGKGARISGIRLQGPDGELGAEAYERPNSMGIGAAANDVQVDNNEIYNWSYAGVSVLIGAQNVHIHHNYIHHVRRTGLGYPVMVNTGTALIEANIFDYYRHAIAGTGYIGAGYEARYNLALPNASSHAFDMHGGGDFCAKGGSCTEEQQRMAGEYVVIHHNTFMATTQEAIRVRGVPRQRLEVYANWFYNNQTSKGFTFLYFNGGNSSVHHNLYGTEKRLVEVQVTPEPFIRSGPSAASGPIVAAIAPYTDVRLKLINPSDQLFSEVKGEMPVAVEVIPGKLLQIAKVEVWVDNNMVYAGVKVPEAKQVIVDTVQLEDGIHRLTLKVFGADGVVFPHSTMFDVHNRWNLVDDLNAPFVENWLGELVRVKTDNDVAGWTYAMDKPEEFAGDAGRRVRTQAQAPAMVWQAPQLEQYAVTLYTKQATLPAGVQLAVSADGNTWTPIPYTVNVKPASSAGWYMQQLTGSVVEPKQVGMFHLKLAESMPLDAVQVGKVELVGLGERK